MRATLHLYSRCSDNPDVKWRTCVFLALPAVLAIACATSDLGGPPPVVTGPDPDRTLRVQVNEAGRLRVVTVALEDYVKGTIISEVAPPAAQGEGIERMLEVQAVIARTYAMANAGRHRSDGFDLCSATHCQLYQPARLKTSRWAANAETAIKKTRGIVLWYENEPARALYHADCGGHTSSATDVWGGTPRPYLQALVDGGPAERAHADWSFAIDRNELVGVLNADSRTVVGRSLSAIRVVERDSAGRAMKVELRGEKAPTLRGETLREILGRGFGSRTVRSTRFDVERKGDKFVFTGRGFGHGVGLCQAGALARIRSGQQTNKILALYYPGTRLVTLGRKANASP
jgi:stage II sporulation protein D